MDEEQKGIASSACPSLLPDAVADSPRADPEPGSGQAKPAAKEEKALIEAQELARLKLEALDAAPLGFLITTRAGMIVWANPAIEQMTGYAPEELLGLTPRVFQSGRQPRSFYRELWEAIVAGRRWQGELTNRRKDGSLYDEEMAITPFRTPQGEISHFLCVKRDISERKATEEAFRRSDELFRQVTENTQEVLFIYTPAPPQVIFLSQAFEQIWGRPRSEVYEQPAGLLDTVHPEDREGVLEAFLEQGQGRFAEIDFRILRPDGTPRWIRVRTFPVQDGPDHPLRVVGFAEDVTARKQAEEELREAHHKLNSALTESGKRERENERLTELVDMIQCCENVEEAYQIIPEVLESAFDSYGGALYMIGASRDVETMACWGRGEGMEKVFQPGDCWALRRGKVHVVPESNSAMRCGHAHVAESAGHICIPLAAHGETMGLLYFECPLSVFAPSSAIYPNPAKRIAEQATVMGEGLSVALANLQLREVLRQQSVRDPLTGLYNRRYMEETLGRELARAARQNDKVAVGICDLDQFKDFNDIFGHDAGDLVLRQIASTLKTHLRQGDYVCRMGGEEFVVILPGASVEVARERLGEVRKQVQSLSLTHRNRALGRITISVGLAGFPQDGSSAEDILRSADRALYQAKREGRNRVVLAS